MRERSIWLGDYSRLVPSRSGDNPVILYNAHVAPESGAAVTVAPLLLGSALLAYAAGLSFGSWKLVTTGLTLWDDYVLLAALLLGTGLLISAAASRAGQARRSQGGTN
ncbi:MAG: hypothetical protein L3J96_01810 [Thermoplasmata archaeon]|nr:hypothetical protein [Thermoplasmata archaeon]